MAILHGYPFGEGGQPRLMGHQVSRRDLFLAGCAECRPIRSHRCVDVELAPLPQQQYASCRQSFGGGEHQLKAVLGPGPSLAMVGHPAPQVNHVLPVDAHRHRRSGLMAI